eukprot:1217673-Rhodomonas_salina.1
MSLRGSDRYLVLSSLLPLRFLPLRSNARRKDAVKLRAEGSSRYQKCPLHTTATDIRGTDCTDVTFCYTEVVYSAILLSGMGC